MGWAPSSMISYDIAHKRERDSRGIRNVYCCGLTVLPSNVKESVSATEHLWNRFTNTVIAEGTSTLTCIVIFGHVLTQRLYEWVIFCWCSYTVVITRFIVTNSSYCYVCWLRSSASPFYRLGTIAFEGLEHVIVLEVRLPPNKLHWETV
jgi:hypothetical protein